MLIDAHYHLVAEEWYPEGWWQAVTNMYLNGMKQLGMEMPLEMIRETLIPALWDPEGESLIRDMDAGGIDKTVLLPMDYWMLFGEPKVSIEGQLKAYADIQKKHPDRIIAFATVDPRRPDAVELLERSVKEWGLRGLNLYPQTGFFMNAPNTYKVLEKASEFNLPVTCHTGQLGAAPLRAKYGDPIHLDDVIQDFPNLIVTAGHMAFGWHEQLFYLAGLRYNIFTDVSAWQDVSRANYSKFCRVLRHALDRLGPNRVLFGTDNPFVAALMSTKDYADLIKDLPQNAPDGITFTEAEVTGILGDNAARILSLTG
ncbi:MAG: amidohydrolase family protein [Dehalococcoidia bacterium]|nr:amidohydrolase family protein [Dehalococcoidia bacterium]